MLPQIYLKYDCSLCLHRGGGAIYSDIDRLQDTKLYFISHSMQNRKTVFLIIGPAAIYG